MYAVLRNLSVAAGSLLLLAAPVFAQNSPEPDKLSPLSKNAPKDAPARATRNSAQKFEEAIAPYVAKARATLPNTKERYLKGLNKGEVLSVTIRLHAEDGKFEQVFVEVKSWKDKTISGLLASVPNLIKGHHLGERLTVEEKDVYDWTISKPDGTEEGNFVGNFLDTYHP